MLSFHRGKNPVVGGDVSRASITYVRRRTAVQRVQQAGESSPIILIWPSKQAGDWRCPISKILDGGEQSRPTDGRTGGERASEWRREELARRIALLLRTLHIRVYVNTAVTSVISSRSC